MGTLPPVQRGALPVTQRESRAGRLPQALSSLRRAGLGASRCPEAQKPIRFSESPVRVRKSCLACSEATLDGRRLLSQREAGRGHTRDPLVTQGALSWRAKQAAGLSSGLGTRPRGEVSLTREGRWDRLRLACTCALGLRGQPRWRPRVAGRRAGHRAGLRAARGPRSTPAQTRAGSLRASGRAGGGQGGGSPAGPGRASGRTLDTAADHPGRSTRLCAPTPQGLLETASHPKNQSPLRSAPCK